jgi:DNA-binding beta-propeller fold protein YncE
MQSNICKWFGIALGSWLVIGALMAAEPKYPKVNVATAYAVDPRWPQQPPESKWDEVLAVAVDGKDQVYVVTRGTPPIQVYTADGRYVRGWGDGQFKGPHFLRFDAVGNVWITDTVRHSVRKFTPEGKLLLTLGTMDHPGQDQSHFNMPTDMAITPSGDVFVSDGYGNARVVHFDREGKYIKEWGGLGSQPGQFSCPHAICLDSKGRLYVADRNNCRIQVFDQSGKLLDVWKDLVLPMGIWVTKDDAVWVCGASPQQWRPDENFTLGDPPKDQLFMKFNGDGKMLQLWTVPRAPDGLAKPGEVCRMHGIAAASTGDLYIADARAKRALKFVAVKPDIP